MVRHIGMEILEYLLLVMDRHHYSGILERVELGVQVVLVLLGHLVVQVVLVHLVEGSTGKDRGLIVLNILSMM
jgi:hypothetical protein